jgi:isoquinoline 1-oxidoreductase alpha subunit
MAASDVEGKTVVTIEGWGRACRRQKAWIEEQVPQCGYCQPGQIMSAVALLKANPKPSDKDIDEVLSNICRCGTYSAIRRAVHRAAALLGGVP